MYFDTFLIYGWTSGPSRELGSPYLSISIPPLSQAGPTTWDDLILWPKKIGGVVEKNTRHEEHCIIKLGSPYYYFLDAVVAKKVT